jgi:hypothetical protein
MTDPKQLWIICLVIIYYLPHSEPSFASVHSGAIFTRIGTLAHGLSYGHITIAIPLKSIEDRINQYENITTILKLLKEESKSLSKREQSRLNYLEFWTKEQMELTQERIRSITMAFHMQHDKQKTKRQALVVAGAAALGGIIGSISGLFRTHSLATALDQRTKVLQANVQSNMILANNNHQDISRLNQTADLMWEQLGHVSYLEKKLNFEAFAFALQFTVSQNLKSIDRTIDGILQAHNGHFSPDLVKIEGVTGALTSLREQALSHDQEIGINNPSEAYQLPTSFLYHRDTRVFSIIVHVPLYQLGKSMDLYELIAAPLKLPSQNKSEPPLFLQVQPNEAFLAIGSDQTIYKTFTAAQLETCLRLDNTYFCPDRALFKIRQASCLSALFRNEQETVKSHCPFGILGQLTQVARINETTYLVTETDITTMTISCDRHHRSPRATMIPIDGPTLVHLEAGCTGSTTNLVIARSRFDIEIQLDKAVIGNPIAPQEFIPDVTPDHLAAIRETLKHVGHPIPLSHVIGLTAFRKAMAKATLSDNDYWPHLYVGATTSLIAMLLCLFCWRQRDQILRCLCRRRPAPYGNLHGNHGHFDNPSAGNQSADNLVVPDSAQRPTDNPIGFGPPARPHDSSIVRGPPSNPDDISVVPGSSRYSTQHPQLAMNTFRFGIATPK